MSIEELEAENARLKAEVSKILERAELAEGYVEDLSFDCRRLKAEVEQVVEDNIRLSQENGGFRGRIDFLERQVDRLTRTGDILEVTLTAYYNEMPYSIIIVREALLMWNATKEGKQS